MGRQLVAQHEGVQPQARGRRVQPVGAAESEHVAELSDSHGPDRIFHVSDRPLQFELIPLVCLVSDVCHHLRLSETQFYRLMARKALALVELQPLDSTRRFSGESLAFEIKRRSQRKVA